MFVYLGLVKTFFLLRTFQKVSEKNDLLPFSKWLTSEEYLGHSQTFPSQHLPAHG